MLAASRPALAREWDDALSAWARARLAEGESGLHATALERFERALLDAALEHTGGRRAEAAQRLGLGRNTLTRKLRSEEHTSALQSLMRISYAAFCLLKNHKSNTSFSTQI